MLRRLKLRISLARIEFLNAFLGDAMCEGFKLGLLFPEFRICAAVRKKLRVRAMLRKFPLLNHVNFIGMLKGRQTMRNHDDRMAASQLACGRNNGSLAFGIDIARGFIEDINGGIVQQGARKRQPLALAARKVRALGGDIHIEPARLTNETSETTFLKSLPQLFIGRMGLGKQQIRAQRALEHVARKRHRGNGLAQRFGRNVAQINASDADIARIARVRAGQNTSERRFARSAFARYANKAAAWRRKIDALEHLAPPIVGIAHATAYDVRIARVNRVRAVNRQRRVEDRIHFLGGSHAIHRRMEKRTQSAHGNEELARQEHDRECGGECRRANRELPQHGDDANRRSAECEQVHNGDRIQLHGKQAHRRFAKAFRRLVHFLVLLGVGRRDFQRGEALNSLEEHAAQIGIAAPVIAHGTARDFLHGHDRRRNEWHAHEQRHSGRKRQRSKRHEQRNGRDQGIEQLGHILAEIALELLGALDAHLHSDAGGNRFVVRGAKGDELIVDLLANGPLSCRGGSLPHALRHRLAHHAHGDGRYGGSHHAHCHRSVGRALERGLQK